MPSPITLGSDSLTPRHAGHLLLAALGEALLHQGVRALLAVRHGDAPVLYVRTGVRTLPVTVTEAPDGRVFLAPGMRLDAADPGHAARRLENSLRPPAPRTGFAPAVPRRRLRAVG